VEINAMRWVRSHLAAALLILIASLLAVLLSAYATAGGPGVGSDATIYLLSAQSLLDGQGLGWMEPTGFHRLDYYPPFYPISVAFSTLLFVDLIAAARWLNILLFAGLAAFLGAWFYLVSRKPLLSGLLSGVLAVSPVLIGVAVWAMSEPVFLLTGFAGLGLLAAYIRRPHPLYLILAALLTGLSFLSRYLGIAFILTGALVVLLAPADRSTSGWKRVGSSLAFGALAVLPMAIWLALDFFLSGTIGGRASMPADQYLPRFFGTFRALEPIVLFWLLPESIANRLPVVLRMLLFLLPWAALAGLGLWIRSRYLRSKDEHATGLSGLAHLALLMGLFILVYLPVLAALQAVIYPPVALDLRMLSPVHVAVIVLAFALVAMAESLLAPRRRWVSIIIVVAACGVFGVYALRGGLVAREYHRTGIGYSASSWQQSPLIEVVRALPADVPLITNDKAAILLLVGRPAYEIAEIYQDIPAAVFTGYGSGSDPAQRIFREQGGALVLFDASLKQDFGIYGDRIDARLSALTAGLYRFYRGEDGAIYFFKQK
jgi:uncharacterized membrane protein